MTVWILASHCIFDDLVEVKYYVTNKKNNNISKFPYVFFILENTS